MRYIFSLILCIYFGIFTCETQAALSDLPALPVNASEYVKQIHTAYRDLQQHLNKKSNGFVANDLLTTLQLVGKLTVSTLYGNPSTDLIPTREKPQDIMAVTKELIYVIKSLKDFETIFDKTLRKLAHRYELANIVNDVALGKAEIGYKNSGFITTSEKVKKTLTAYTGRIFVVDPEREIIHYTGSGMILPRTEGGTTYHDRIITCCHCVEASDNNPELEFYFVRSEVLRARTGLPNKKEIRQALGLEEDKEIHERHLVRYLRSDYARENNHVRCINSFHAFDNPLHKKTNLSHHSPLYRKHQDNGYGLLAESFIFDSAHHFANVQECKSIPDQALDYKYYALGYPTFPYCGLSSRSPLTQDMELAPLTVTSGVSNTIANAQYVLRIDNSGSLVCEASASKGMSGGPVFTVDNHENIWILGVVSSGYLDKNYACKFW